LFLWERTSAVVAAVRLVPAARLAGVAAGVDGAGAAPLGAGLVGDADGLGRVVVRLGVLAGAGALAVGRSFSSALVSTGAS
jgi:hypothetical protein